MPAVPTLREELRRGCLLLPPHPRLTLPPYQWRVLPTGDRNWGFQYQSLAFLRGLLSSEDGRDRGEAMRWIHAWATAHRPGVPAHPMAWYPHAAAVRALILATAAAGLLAHGRRATADLAVLVECLEWHRRFLADPSHCELSNHGLTQALALIDTERVLQRCRRGHAAVPERPDLVGRAVTRFLRVVDRGISFGGVHTEGAPGYHLYFLEQTLAATDYLTAILPTRQARRLDDLVGRLARMYERMWYLSDLHGRLPPVGDTEVVAPQAALARIRRRLVALTACRASGPPAFDGAPPGAGPVLYDADAGFAVFKQTRGRGRYLIFRIQDREPAAHAHNDALSVVFQENGVDVFVDSGKYTYNYDDPIRRYVISRAAHNTAEPQGAHREAYVVAHDRERLRTRAAAFVATARRAAGRFVHRRAVCLPARGGVLLRVTDEMQASQGYLLTWHLGSALRLEAEAVTARSARFASPGHGIAIELRADHEITCHIGPARPGDPPGWRSARWGEWTTGPVLLVRPRSRGASRFAVQTVVRRTASAVSRQ